MSDENGRLADPGGALPPDADVWVFRGAYWPVWSQLLDRITLVT